MLSLAIANGATRLAVHAAGKLLAAMAGAALVAMVSATAYLYSFAARPAPVFVVVNAPEQVEPAKIDYDRFKHIWVGVGDHILVHGAPESIGQEFTHSLVNDAALKGLFAVAIDKDGAVYMKKLSSEQLNSPFYLNYSFESGKPPKTEAFLASLLAEQYTTAAAVKKAARIGMESSPPAYIHRDLLPDDTWLNVPGQIRRSGADGATIVIGDKPLVPDLILPFLEINSTPAGEDANTYFRLNSVTVPEPGALGLLVLAGLLLRRRSR